MIFKKRLTVASIVYWFLLLYIIAALVWWFIALQEQNARMTSYQLMELRLDQPDYIARVNSIVAEQHRKQTRNIGEGASFMLVILVGAIFVYRAVRRQIKLQQQQQNFMMAVTHELKTPIAVAKLNMETLLKFNLDPVQKQKFITSALQEMNRLNTLANNILVASQLEASEHNLAKERIDLSAIVRQIADGAAANFAHKTWTRLIQPGLSITADRLLIEMLTSNLVENAIKYSPADSTITIELKKTGSRIRLGVADQGPGIPSQERKKIFEKFYRIGNETTRSAPGTGLGLYLCKKIAEYHHAHIQVSDNLPRGSIFTVTF